MKYPERGKNSRTGKSIERRRLKKKKLKRVQDIRAREQIWTTKKTRTHSQRYVHAFRDGVEVRSQLRWDAQALHDREATHAREELYVVVRQLPVRRHAGGAVDHALKLPQLALQLLDLPVRGRTSAVSRRSKDKQTA